MGAGKPDYNRLHALGKLPKDQRHMIPGLREADSAAAELERIKAGMCDDCKAKLFPNDKKAEVKPAPAATTTPEEVKLVCEHPGCGAVIKGKTEEIAKTYLQRHKDAQHKNEA